MPPVQRSENRSVVEVVAWAVAGFLGVGVLAKLLDWLFGIHGLPLIVDLALLLILVLAGIAFAVGGFWMTRAAEQRWAAPAPFGEPVAVAVDGAGGIVVADRLDNRVITLAVDGAFDAEPARAGPAAIATYKGRVLTADAKSVSSDDDAEVPGCEELRYPMGLVVARDGSLFVSETGRDRVVHVANGRLEVIAGGHGRGFDGDGDVACQARLASPRGLALDPDGRLYIADRLNHRIRRIDRDGRITTVAGTGTPGGGGDGGPARRAELRLPIAVAVGSLGELLIADEGNGLVRSVTQDGRIRTVAGAGGQALRPTALAALPDGDVLIADGQGRRIWRLRSDGVMGAVRPDLHRDERRNLRRWAASVATWAVPVTLVLAFGWCMSSS